VLLAYLGLIPTFALVFCFLHGQQFYAPYARFEPLAIADAARVKKSLAVAMVKSYASYEASTSGWQIARSDIEVDDLATDSSNGLMFTVYFFATKHEGEKITAAVGGPQFTAKLSQEKIVTQQRPGWMVCHLVTVLQNSGTEGPAMFNNHLLFRPPAMVAIQADTVCWGGEEEIALQNLVTGWLGDPRGLSGFPWRMAYFSATTITTVGFGDIVPLTGTARALTAIEAIAGWVLAGIFLNSLASRIAQRKLAIERFPESSGSAEDAVDGSSGKHAENSPITPNPPPR
jgi:hypothetical protein